MDGLYDIMSGTFLHKKFWDKFIVNWSSNPSWNCVIWKNKIAFVLLLQKALFLSLIMLSSYNQNCNNALLRF